MSRRNKREAAGAAPAGAQSSAGRPLERWPQPVARRWQIVISAACMLAWLAFLLFLALRYGD